MLTNILTIVISILISCLVIFFITKNRYIRELYKNWDYRKYDIKRNIYSFVKDIIILILTVILIIFIYSL